MIDWKHGKTLKPTRKDEVLEIFIYNKATDEYPTKIIQEVGKINCYVKRIKEKV